MTEPVRVVVCDAGPLIHLDELDCLELLADFHEILVADAVWQEVAQHRPPALQVSSLALRRLSRRTPGPTLKALAEIFTLHRGELEALDIARSTENSLLLTDDIAARLAARTLQIPVHGSVGIVIRAIRRRQKSKAEVLELPKAIPFRTSLFIKPRLLAELIREVEVTSEG